MKTMSVLEEYSALENLFEKIENAKGASERDSLFREIKHFLVHDPEQVPDEVIDPTLKVSPDHDETVVELVNALEVHPKHTERWIVLLRQLRRHVLEWQPDSDGHEDFFTLRGRRGYAVGHDIHLQKQFEEST